MQERDAVLVVDDDPAQQRIYGWILEAAGYRALAATVRYDRIDLPDEGADLVLLDYNLGGQMTAVEVAREIRSRQPNLPILILSDRWELPEDIAPLVQGFVRKGEPAKLVATLARLLGPERSVAGRMNA